MSHKCAYCIAQYVCEDLTGTLVGYLMNRASIEAQSVQVEQA